MEEVMTQESAQTADLKTWWDNAGFPGKELYDLHENGDLVLQVPGTAGRTVSTLTPETADSNLKALVEKFQEVEAKVQELKTDWAQTDDKLKLLGKVERTKEYLQHTNAAGNFQALLADIAPMENELHKLTEENYQARLKLAEQAEGIADSDNWKESAQQMRDLSEQWKQIGFTDKQRSDELWNRLETAKNKFFDRKRQNQEDVNKELLQNLDLKMEIVDKAENLAASENWKETTAIFRDLVEEWKNTGRTMHEKNEELWHRFITAKNVFYDRKKAHFDSIQVEQDKNYDLKLALVQRAEELKDSKDWGKAAQAFSQISEDWKKIGRVPLDKADEIWNRLNAAREHFFQTKRDHFATVKVGLEDNYAQKLALLKRAEALKDSSQWHEATDELNELMTEWKQIGPVPREHSDAIWEQFISARKAFFNRKDANREQRKQMMSKRRGQRLQQTRSFHNLLQSEIKEEKEKLADFQNGIENITPGHKEQELRQHLTKLIEQTSETISRKQKKLEGVKKELEELENQEQRPQDQKKQKAEASTDATAEDAMPDEEAE